MLKLEPREAGVRHSAKEPRTADWLFDLLAKLGQEDDAYHGTCLVLMHYADDAAGPEAAGDEEAVAFMPDATAQETIARLPKVVILEDRTPPELASARFLVAMVSRVLGATPVNMHGEARRRRAEAAAK